MDISKRLTELGIQLPNIPKPIASYELYSISDNLIYISGQGPTINGKNIYTGKIGKDLTKEDGYEAAKLCALNMLAILNDALGDLNKVDKIINMHGYVNSSNDFYEQPYVINGASDLMVDIFGEAGKHSRAAVSVYSLPMNIAVETEMIVRIKI